MGSVQRPPFPGEVGRWLFVLFGLRSAKTLPYLEVSGELEDKFDLTAEAWREAQIELGIHRKRMIRKVEGYRSSMTAHLRQVFAASRADIFRQERLFELATRELDAIIKEAERQRRLEKYQPRVYSCPHCGKRLLLKKGAANKIEIVKCPYRGCRRRIRVFDLVTQ